MAPMTAGFSAGNAVGPALGAVLASAVGVSNTFLVSGAMYSALLLLNQATLFESKPPPPLRCAPVSFCHFESRS
jgi:predicted MFS family arabinose efflux permease